MSLHKYKSTELARMTGFSLVELMIAMTIGIFMLLGITTMFANSNRSSKELEKYGNLIENGRYGIQVLFEDIRHAGFYGQFYDLPGPPALAPDPCTLIVADMEGALGLPVHGYGVDAMNTRPDLSATSCGALLGNTNLSPGSDILVIRRTSTTLEDIALLDPNDVYLQTTMADKKMDIGLNSVNFTLTVQDGTSTVPADIRKFRTHVYFVAPCSAGTGTDGVCTAADDAIPTLKRLELSGETGATAMVINPLVEGVAYLKLDYGIDATPDAATSSSGLTGDSIPDTYVNLPSSLTEWQNVMSVWVYLLSRATAGTPDHVDNKTYNLGTWFTVPPFRDAFRRKVFSSEIRLNNQAGRREAQ